MWCLIKFHFALPSLCARLSDLAAEQVAARVHDRRRSSPLLAVHHLRREPDHAQGVAGGVRARRLKPLPRHHQPLHQAAPAFRRAQAEVVRPVGRGPTLPAAFAD